jgi:hypothetical protein
LEQPLSPLRSTAHLKLADTPPPSFSSRLSDDLDDKDDTSPASMALQPPPAPQTQSQYLIDLARDAELFHAPDGTGYARIRVKDHWETHAIKDNSFKNWLRQRFYTARGGAPAAQALAEAVDTLIARSQFEGPQHEVALRVAEVSGKLYIDLCDDEWRAVEISNGTWRIVADPPVRFRRSPAMAALPDPDPTFGSVDRLRQFLNVDGDGWILLVGWLIGAFRPTGPYPLLHLTGEQGTAKSTTARLLRSLVDPSRSPLREAPRNSEDLMISATQCWIPTFDNLSYIRQDLSDALCRLSTGGGYATRKHYTNTEEVIIEATRPVIITGIGSIVTRSDLMDRTLVVPLYPFDSTSRKTEAQLWQSFERSQAMIFTGLLDAVARAYQHPDPPADIGTIRLADFANWVTQAEPALGWNRGTFVTTYLSARNEAMDDALEDSLVGMAVAELMQMLPEDTWEHTPSNTYEALKTIAAVDARRIRQFPSTPAKLTTELKRIAPLLRRRGIEVITGTKDSLGNRVVIFQKG